MAGLIIIFNFEYPSQQSFEYYSSNICTFAFFKNFIMSSIQIKSALVSVFHKDGLDNIVRSMADHNIEIYSTGGTLDYIESLGLSVKSVESITDYPSILDGRVKTLHPKVFGGILAKRNQDHLSQLEKYNIPTFDLVIVDLYPFEKTVLETQDESKIIEKIDIGGISLIRAAAKNYREVVIIPSMNEYSILAEILQDHNATTDLTTRKDLAMKAFATSSHYDTAIFHYFNKEFNADQLRISQTHAMPLRYGENPHQKAIFYGNHEDYFEILGGKELSYNNILDMDAAVNLIKEFSADDPTIAIIKHTNPCGVATRPTLEEAWSVALSSDPVSAFGGIFISNRAVDVNTAAKMDELFFEIVIAPDYSPAALDILTKKKNRRIIKLKKFSEGKQFLRSVYGGFLSQDEDETIVAPADWKIASNTSPADKEQDDLFFASKCVKHLKSNAIALVKEKQLIGMGCGQTSRVDALRQAIAKAGAFGFSLHGAVMASDAFFPFPDCVEIAHQAGITAVIHPGGSVKDQDSIDFCNEHGMGMAITGERHFRH